MKAYSLIAQLELPVFLFLMYGSAVNQKGKNIRHKTVTVFVLQITKSTKAFEALKRNGFTHNITSTM